MVTNPVTPIPPYTLDLLPLPQVTPFTFRDGQSFLERMERIVYYINNVVLPTINSQVNDLGEEFVNEVNGLITEVNNALGNLDGQSVEQAIDALTTFVNTSIGDLAGKSVAQSIADLTQFVNDTMQEVINDGIQVQDPVMAGVIANTASASYTAWTQFNKDNRNNKLKLINAGDYATLAAAVADLTAGDTLFIPSGTYNENISITGINDLTILSEGGIITGSDTTAKITVTSCNNLRISGLKIRGTATGQVTGGYGIAVSSSNNVVISECEISGTAHMGLIFSGQCSYVRVINNYVHNTQKDGIHVNDGCCFVVISGNQLAETGDDSIAVVSYNTQVTACHDVIVSNNVVYHSKARGISLVGGYNAVYANNDISATGMAGIYIAQETTTYTTYSAENVTVIGNRVIDPNTYSPAGNMGGIVVYARSAAYIVKKIRLLQNSVIGARYQSIQIDGSASIYCQDIDIQGNNIYTSLNSNGIEIIGTQDAVVRNNVVKDVVGSGLVVSSSSAGVIVVEDNYINNAGLNQYGINVTGPATFFVRRNIIVDTDMNIAGAIQGSGVTGILNLSNNTVPNGKASTTPAIQQTPARDFFPQIFNSAVPAAGSWERSQIVWNQSPAASTTPGWICVTSGTFGTLTGVTATTTNGSATVTVSDATNLQPGMWVTIAGVTGSKKVFTVSGTTIVLSSACDADTTGSAVAYVTPVFKAMANLAA